MPARKAAIIGCIAQGANNGPGYAGVVKQVKWSDSHPTKVTTTTTSAVALPATTIPVTSSAGFSTTSGPNPGNNGVVLVYTEFGPQYVAFTGVSGGNTLTGCTGGIGTVKSGAPVIGGGFDWTAIETGKAAANAFSPSAVPMRMRCLSGTGVSVAQTPSWVITDVGTIQYYEGAGGQLVTLPKVWAALYGDYYGLWMAAMANVYDNDPVLVEIQAGLLMAVFCEPFQLTSPPGNDSQIYNAGTMVAAGFTDALFFSGLSRGMHLMQVWKRTNPIHVFQGYHRVDSKARNDTCTTQSSTTVLDPSILASDNGRGVSGQDILQNTSITAVTPGVSFTINHAATGSTVGALLCIGDNTDTDDERAFMAPIASYGWTAGHANLRSITQFAMMMNTSFRDTTNPSGTFLTAFTTSGPPMTGQTNANPGTNPDLVISIAVQVGVQSMEIGNGLVAILGNSSYGAAALSTYTSQMAANAKVVR